MKTIRLILLFATLAGLVTLTRAAERSSVQGILISASNESGETDRRLAPYEPTLRRILRFESFRFLGDDTATLDVSEPGHLSLGSGHELSVSTERIEGNSIHVRVRWSSGGRTLMNTGLVLRAGVPAVLGGPSTGNKGDVYAVILIGR
jgi:hypothetical protein